MADLRRAVAGPVHLPGDVLYDKQRATWSGTIDSRPAVVVEALTQADVRAALVAARDHDLPFAVQGSGHGTLVPADGGVLVKTSRMAHALVDPDRRVAHVGAGARWRDVIAAAEPFGLAPLSGSSPDVGVAGFTLGGGVGWLSRRHGLGADNLVRAEVVTADGRSVTASEDAEPELFWALRGAGANVAIATSLEVRLFPVSRVFAGAALFPIERAADALTWFRDHADELPDELNVSMVLMRREHEGPVLAVRGVHLGTPAEARRALRPLWKLAGPPLVDGYRSTSYAGTATIGGTAPRQFELFAALPDEAIAAAIDAVALTRAPANAIEVRHWGGALARADADAGPVGHRGIPFSMTIDGPAEAVAPLARFATGGSFLNFLQDTRRTESAYTRSDYRRLQEIKRTYDPDNLLGRSHNIPPASATAQRTAA
jgi:FAD/FMN-containing dehydrogenase